MKRENIRRSFLSLALCHELKQPLHSLNLNVELMSKRLAKAKVPEADFEGPLGALGRVVDRVNDCLDSFSAKVGPEPVPDEPRPLQPAVQAAADRVRERARRAGVTVTMQLSGDLPPVAFHPEQMAEALDAILDNAIRASAKGSSIVMSVTVSDDDIRIEISDRGMGMSADVVRHAIEIGYSTWGGSGVGMTVAKFITYHHGGGFQVSSTPGQGTTVTMTLPVVDIGV